jgi:hypothetical protein
MLFDHTKCGKIASAKLRKSPLMFIYKYRLLVNMEGHKFKIRKKWKQFKDFIPFNEEDLKNQINSDRDFDEYDTWIETEFGYTIDFGWYGNYGKRQLTGMIVKLFDWDNPVESKDLYYYNEAIEWAEKWIKKIEMIEDSMTDNEKKLHIKQMKEVHKELNPHLHKKK